MDKRCFKFSLKTEVPAQKDQRDVHQLQGGSGKKSYSVLFAISGSGDGIPQFIIFQGKQMRDKWSTNCPERAVFATSEKGCKDKEIFLQYFKHFVEWCRDRPKPLLLLLDGHGSHMQY